MTTTQLLGFFGMIGNTEMIVIGVVAVLLFGSRLPSVARSMGRSLTEFKKGMQGLEDEVKSAAYSEPSDSIGYEEEDRSEPTAPAFTPPPAEERQPEEAAR